jgi:hypothetical protein
MVPNRNNYEWKYGKDKTGSFLILSGDTGESGYSVERDPD